MILDKKAINYYYSFYDVSKDLSEKQFYQFNMAIYKVMFFDEHIDNIKFEDKTLTMLWKSVKHSIYASVKGYCDKKQIPYDDVFSTPCQPPYEAPCQQEQEEEKEKGKEKEKEEFSFSLTRETQFENLSVEYKNKLKEEIDKLNLSLTYDDFVEGLMIRTYKYKNFLLAYQKWAKNSYKKTNTKDDDYTLEDLKKFGYKG